MIPERLFRYWGKAGTGDTASAHHPLAYHSLDVAAVGRLLLQRHDLLRRRLAEVSGLSEAPLVGWVTFLLAIHDTGKFSDGFQALRRDLMARLQGREVDVPYPERHDLLGYRLWDEALRHRLRDAGELFPGQENRELWCDLLNPWIRAAAGHHGLPPRPRRPAEKLGRQFPPQAEDDALELVRFAARKFLDGRIPFDLEPFDEQEDRFRRASWLFAGLAVAADWIGSNSSWFPFHEAPSELADYWRDVALPHAEAALDVSGTNPAPSSMAGGLRTLWPGFATATPLQALAEETVIASGPQLLVIEEVTGGGKTEAALVLAHRLMAAGLASGIYLGLPTMATANAMYRRAQAVYRRLFDGAEEPSLILAHSRQKLFLPLEQTPTDKPYSGGEPTGSLDCAAWLMDSRKKALLAHVGVGTIDQALLAVLPLRHQSLRLWGLAGKVLIADEVHACDTYVRGLLCDLLTFHAALGGSAILLSATLPTSQRRELADAFAAGAGFERRVAREPSPAYPLLTHCRAEGVAEHPVAARPEAAREVVVHPVRTPEEVEQLLVREMVEGGGCACWIRNTVRDALASHAAMTSRLGAGRVSLFHSRFTVGDRAEIEEEVLRRFGPKSTGADRRGRLLIATQVIEQSLDLDFDLLAVDLAPIDLVVQRAGRLRRHRRDAAGDCHEAADARGPAVLAVLSPEPIADPEASWYASLLPGAARVYPDHGRLWLTARWLEERGGFRMPEDARELVEFVYGTESEERVPEGLQRRTEVAAGKSAADRAFARHNALKLDRGYEATALDWPDDAYLPTRLGEPTVTLRLVRSDGRRLAPWYASRDHAWERSEVQVRRALVAAEATGLAQEDLDALRARMPDQGRYVILVVLEVKDGVWSGSALDAAQREVQLSYSAKVGLQVFRPREETHEPGPRPLATDPPA